MALPTTPPHITSFLWGWRYSHENTNVIQPEKLLHTPLNFQNQFKTVCGNYINLVPKDKASSGFKFLPYVCTIYKR
jgi:hypothetical protein